MNKNNLIFLFGILVGIFFLIGCQKENIRTYELEYNQSLITIKELREDKNNLSYRILELKQELEKLEDFYHTYNKALQAYQYGVITSSDAEYNYDLFSWAYGENYLYDAIDYCESARLLYADSNSYHQSAKQYFIEARKVSKTKYNELIDTYIKFSDSTIEINWVMYEACEYFESASSYYSKNLWDTANAELEEANKKIAYHDNLIVRHNEIVARLKILS